MLQTILCFIIVFAALSYIVCFYFMRRKKDKLCSEGCGGSSCGVNNQNKVQSISIPLSNMNKNRRK